MSAGSRYVWQGLRRALSLLAEPGRVPALIILAVLMVIRLLDPVPVETLRLRAFDLEQRLVPRQYAQRIKSGEYRSPAVAIVAIDHKSLAEYGQWPWPRFLVAKLVRAIASGDPAVLGVDIYFAEPDRFSPANLAKMIPGLPQEAARALRAMPDSDAALGQTFRAAPTVFGVGVTFDVVPHPPARSRSAPPREKGGDPRPFLKEYRYPQLVQSMSEITAGETSRGALVGAPDSDGILRRFPLIIIGENNLIPSLSVEMLRVGIQSGPITIETSRGGIDGIAVGSYFIPTDRNGRGYPYFTPSLDNRYISAADILDGTFAASKLNGWAVLLGLKGLGLIDVKPTPMGPMEGVEVHAQMLECILSGQVLRRPWRLSRVEIALTLVAGLLAIFALPYGRPRVAAAGFIVLIALLLGAEFASFRMGRLLLDATYPALTVVATFGVMLWANLHALAVSLEQEHEREARMEGELEAASAIQMGLLPRDFPGAPERTDVEVFASIEPARAVGGDLYDFAFIDATHLWFTIADVSGKGIPAALFMAMSKEVLRGATLHPGVPLDKGLCEANAKIADADLGMTGEGANMMFVTAFTGVLDLASGKLVYVNAGHDSPFVLHPGAEPAELSSQGGPPLGTVDDFPYPMETRQLRPGEALLLYTDGVTEAENSADQFYGMVRLRTTLAAAPADGARSVVDFVREDVRRFVSGAPQADDITLLAVRWIGPARG